MLSNIASAISTVKEGYEKPDAKVNLDIQHHKLLQWLLERKRIDPKWKAQTDPITEKVEKARNDLDAFYRRFELEHGEHGDAKVDELKSLLADKNDDDPLHYFDCKRILELLQSSKEGQQRSFFGSYTSDTIVQWRAILSAYESNHAYLGECARLLKDWIDYQIPALHRSIERSQKNIADMKRKQGGYRRHLEEMRVAYRNDCALLGIVGVNVDEELPSLLVELPQCYEKTVNAARKQEVKEAMELYRDFVKFMVSTEHKSTRELTHLTRLIENGNEVMHDELVVSKSGDSDANLRKKEEKEGESGGIDWDVGDADAVAGGIDWDIDVTESDQLGGDSTDVAQIDWDLGANDDAHSGAIEVVAASNNENSTKEELERLERTLLGRLSSRNEFLDDVEELLCFITQRLEDIQTPQSIINVNTMKGAPKRVQEQSESTLRCMQSALQDVLDTLGEKRAAQLIEMSVSTHYVDRLSASFRHRQEAIRKCALQIDELAKKCDEVSAQASGTVPKIEKLRQRALHLRQQLQAELSKLYSGRIVTIQIPKEVLQPK